MADKEINCGWLFSKTTSKAILHILILFQIEELNWIHLHFLQKLPKLLFASPHLRIATMDFLFS